MEPFEIILHNKCNFLNLWGQVCLQTKSSFSMHRKNSTRALPRTGLTGHLASLQSNFKLIPKIQSNSALDWLNNKDILKCGGGRAFYSYRSTRSTKAWSINKSAAVLVWQSNWNSIIYWSCEFSFSILFDCPESSHEDIDRFRDVSWSALDIYRCH